MVLSLPVVSLLRVRARRTRLFVTRDDVLVKKAPAPPKEHIWLCERGGCYNQSEYTCPWCNMRLCEDCMWPLGRRRATSETDRKVGFFVPLVEGR